MFRALIVRPGLWSEAIRAAFAMAPSGWWRRPPFVPVPEQTYLAWRRVTAYGRPDVTPTTDDLLHFLEWRRRERRSR